MNVTTNGVPSSSCLIPLDYVLCPWKCCLICDVYVKYEHRNRWQLERRTADEVNARDWTDDRVYSRCHKGHHIAPHSHTSFFAVDVGFSIHLHHESRTDAAYFSLIHALQSGCWDYAADSNVSPFRLQQTSPEFRLFRCANGGYLYPYPCFSFHPICLFLLP